MFGNSKPTENKAKTPATPDKGETSVLAAGTRIEGNVRTTESIRLDGVVIGNLTSNRRVVMGDGSSVVGDVRADSASIGGNVDGKVEVNSKLQILKTGRIIGGLKASEFAVEQGGYFEGTTSIGGFSDKIEID
jgi:cytoskeletal protein CcmA (bactofilin family)